ncbi:MAG TPA: glycosyltransferase family 2 protein [Burkholderiales bacterium]|jgi:glycosyltransferase involved in cell wall biosynthesis|nr:glycosyltransferase family 2 protein [Burkholderiales bacterium]
MKLPSASHLVLIPSYNSGPMAVATVSEARRQWNPVWVVVDGSTDGSAQALLALARKDAGVRVFVLPVNRGKGAALLHGLREAVAAGFTHILTMDADGQHPAARIPELMAASRAAPGAAILGEPVFDHSAPLERVIGRRICDWWTNVETLWAGIHDSLFGFRVYPALALLRVMESTRWMRRFDFDAEAVVRLAWAGTKFVNIRVPVRYLSAAEGGVSHFRYLRDNVLLTWMHLRLLAGFAMRLPRLLASRMHATEHRAAYKKAD